MVSPLRTERATANWQSANWNGNRKFSSCKKIRMSLWFCLPKLLSVYNKNFDWWNFFLSFSFIVYFQLAPNLLPSNPLERHLSNVQNSCNKMTKPRSLFRSPRSRFGSKTEGQSTSAWRPRARTRANHRCPTITTNRPATRRSKRTTPRSIRTVSITKSWRCTSWSTRTSIRSTVSTWIRIARRNSCMRTRSPLVYRRPTTTSCGRPPMRTASRPPV